MRKFIVSTIIAGSLALATAVPVLADAQAPTNGGSANGAGSSGQCTGDMASRPASCHNDKGAGN